MPASGLAVRNLPDLNATENVFKRNGGLAISVFSRYRFRLKDIYILEGSGANQVLAGGKFNSGSL